MDIVYTPVWQNLANERPALDFVQDEIYLMELVEGLGFDACFSPEHHFDINYSACPDNFIPLAYLAAKTTKLKVGLGAIILPWNTPLRAVEKLALLDHLSHGRCLAGFGRGLARMEYAHFGIPMEESRDRFDESVAMVLTALRTGVIEGDGPYYQQVRTPIHPRPRPGLAEKFFSVGMSPDSAAVAGKIGGRLLGFVTKPLAGMMPLFDEYMNAFKAAGHRHTPHIVLDDFFYVADSADEAQERGTQYLTNYFRTVIDHYEMAGTHFDNTKGYAAHAETARAMRDTSFENAAAAYCACQVGFGSPDQILAKLEERFRVLGPEISMAGCFFFGGMQRGQAEASMRLFGKKVIPGARDLARSYAREPEHA